MPRIYRTMSREGNRPRLGSTARSLGVRIPQDISIVKGIVYPGMGGMSVAPTWRDLKAHRIPRRLRHLAPEATGSNQDACWAMGAGPFEQGMIAENLTLRLASPTHGLVEPSEAGPLDRYLSSLIATRDLWQIDEA